MRKFTIKFLISFLLLLLPACYFHLYVTKHISGDIGKLGLIPFGNEYEGLDVSWYHQNLSSSAEVIDVYNRDSVKLFPIITIGDSFSQLKKNGYQYALSSKSGTAVANIKHPDNINVANCYAALLNNGYLAGGQTVILESVERYLIQRLCDLDTLNKSDCCIDYAPFTDNNKAGIPFLNRFFSWIRINLNFENPIAQFQLSEECFTHTKFSRTLFVYNSAADGDIAWHHIPEDSFTKAGRQMERLIQCSREQGINLIIMIATDKYDAYEPWISDEHQENPTLSRVPHNPQILDTRPILRQAIDAGVKDVYKINNTHWSVVGADLVGEAIYERMKQIQWLPQTSSR